MFNLHSVFNFVTTKKRIKELNEIMNPNKHYELQERSAMEQNS